MNNLNVIYSGNKNTYLEEKVLDIAISYHGFMVEEFSKDPEGFGAIFAIPSAAQESNFKRDVEHVAKYLQINVSFGGVITL